MQKRKNYNPNQGPKFQTYNAIKDQLQQQNALLLRQRQNMQTKTKSPYNQTIPSQYTIIQQSGLSEDYDADEYTTPAPVYNKPKGSKMEAVYKKIQEVIQICDEDTKINPNSNFRQIAEAEKQLLKYLSTSYNSTFNKNQTSKISKNRVSQNKIQKQTIREQISERGITVSDDIMEMIEQIQRKALTEIQSLRADKIALMKKLNTEIKAHNSERKKRAGYEARANNLTYQLQRTAGSKRPESPQIPNTIYQEQEQQFPTPGQQFKQEGDQYNEQYNQQSQQRQSQQQRQQKSRQLQQPSSPQCQLQQLAQIQPQSQPRSQMMQSQHQRQGSIPRQARQVQSQNTNSVQRNTFPLSNQNIPHTQSVQYHNLQARPSHPRVVEVNSEIQIENEINRLRQQNNQMRNTLSRHNSQTVLPIKQQLRSQLMQLETKARQYEQLIANSRKTNTQTGFDSRQIESLLAQAENLTEQGQRLMRVRSKPQIRNMTGGIDLGYQYENNYENNQVSDIRRPTKTSLDNDGPQMQRASRINNSNNNQFSPGDYQRLLQQMKRATNA